MENIIPGFSHHKHHHDDLDEYGRRRPEYVPGYSGGGGVYEYTGQPVGFEHLASSSPRPGLEDMDARTIAQLGYEGPEGERRKVEAIQEQIYEREYEREGYRNGVPIEGYRHREGYPDGYDRERHRGSIPRYEDEYRRGGSRHGERYDERYSGSRPVVAIPVTVERKFEEDGTVVENLYPDNTVSSLYTRPDYGKIHYGRQDSFPETALQEAAESARRHGRYPGRYPNERVPPPYAPPHSDSGYGRRYEGSSSDYIDERERRRF